MKTGYSYIIIKENYPELARESTLLPSTHYPKLRYAFIEKQVFKDGSEAINRIDYSDDLPKLHNIAKEYISWYNYPIGIAKNIQGYLREI